VAILSRSVGWAVKLKHLNCVRNACETIKTVFVAGFVFGAASLHAQSSNQVWFVSWNGQPTPSSDVSVQKLSTVGSGAAVAAGAASNFVSQINFPSFNSPYDIAVDPAMGKVYVLDNNLQGVTPEYIYSFNLTGTPAQIAASAQIVYTMPVPQADVNAGLYPLVSGIALDAVNHRLYFCQIDVVTSSNSFIGRLDLTSSSKSDAFSSATNNPTLQTYYTGQIPGQGPIAIDATNIYIGAINGLNGNDGIYAAPLTGSGTFSEIVTLSAGNTTFTNGFVSGVASNPQNNLIYYLTWNAGLVNHNFNTSQNAVWAYNTVSHTQTKISSGYPGYPDNIALDPANNRYYFTIGQDGTGNATPTNHQAIYTGALGSTNVPTLFYTPVLSGQDVAANAGNVAIQGVYVVDVHRSPVAGADGVCAQKNLPLNVPVADLLTNDSDPDGAALSIAAVSNTSTNGCCVSLNGGFVTYTPVTNFVGRDQFTYTLANSQGGQTQGTVMVKVLSLSPPSGNRVAIAIAPNDRFLLYAGVSGQNYVVQYANSLNGPWQDLSPIFTNGASGFIEYNDLISPPPATRFYRVRTSP
jgi:hypothetical protein